MEKELPLRDYHLAETADQLAWDAIRNWPSHANVDVIHEGLDFSEHTRWFLWDKVGRAIRKKNDPYSFEFEKALLNKKLKLNSIQTKNYSYKFKHTIRVLYNENRNLLHRTGVILKTKTLSYRQGLHVLYLPWKSKRLQGTVKILTTSRSNIVIGPPPKFFAFSSALKEPKTFRRRINFQFTDQLHEGILEGLKAFGIELISQDVYVLKQQLAHQAECVKHIEAELKMTQPDAILVHADNHPPYQDFVLVGHRENIPSIMLQHGLDCERYYLDEAYATAIAVWGKNRLKRYKQDSRQQPAYIEVTGNPEYDHLRLPSHMDKDGDYWLWATRPHTPEKCYAPSRKPIEGIEIFKTLIKAMDNYKSARLVVKPHPFDYTNLYHDYISKNRLGDKVEISTNNLQHLIPGAKIVISEDSTAGMEAMFWGKILVFAHLTESRPTTPFVDYGAALPAFSKKMLLDSLQHAERFTSSELQSMYDGQRAFLLDFAGPCDGQAAKRIDLCINRIVRNQKQ